MNTNIEVLKQDYILKEVVHSLSSAESIKARLITLIDTYTNKKHYAKTVEDWGNHWASMVKTKEGMKLKKMFIKTRFKKI